MYEDNRMIYLFLVIILILTGLVAPKSKLFFCFNILLVVFLSTHFSGGNDISNIEDSFYATNFNVNEGERSWVFYSLLLWLNDNNISFDQFRLIDCAIWGIPIFGTIYLFCKHKNYVASTCLLFPILSFSSQIRNGITVGFVYLAIISLFLLKDKKYGISLYILFTIISGLFHYIGFLYLLGLLALINFDPKKYYNYVFIGTILLFFLYTSGSVFSLIGGYSSWYADTYLAGGGNKSWFLFIVLSAFIIINYKWVENCEYKIMRSKELFNASVIEFTCFVTRLNFVFLPFIVLILLNGNMFRVYQNLFILSVITISNASVAISHKNGKGNDYRLLYFLFFILLTTFYNKWQGEFLSFFNSIKL